MVTLVLCFAIRHDIKIPCSLSGEDTEEANKEETEKNNVFSNCAGVALLFVVV